VSQETLDLRRSIQIIRRHKLLMGVMLALGILAGGAYAVLKPATVSSTALVLLSQNGEAAQSGAEAAANGGPDPWTATQLVIAKSDPVLAAALPHVSPAVSLNQLRNEVDIASQTPYIISVSAEAKSGADAAATANAVANSYIAYIGSPNNLTGQVQSQLLQPATRGTGSSLLKHLVSYSIFALLGAIFGAAIGAVIALAVTRSDRRLRQRDEIANSIGVPVLASFPVRHPSNPGDWTRLLKDYKPGALNALQLRKALQQLEIGAAEANFGRGTDRWSFTVLSLSSDPGALALGPQLAIFAASQGIPTTLVIAPQPEATVTASLRTACAAPPASSEWPKYLRAIVSDGDAQGGAEGERDAMLAVVVGVVDSRNPQVPDMMRTTATLLGVSAGAATADQLARAAVSAVSDGREITGILVADPDSDDATTGRLPQLGRRGQRRLPTRMTGIATEIRR
jgi:capsular polysaccharide biosynthesis protein